MGRALRVLAMIKFRNGGRLIQSKSELPDCTFDDLFLDFETKSNDPQKNSLNPWKYENCQIIGAAITGDDYPGSIFVPREILLQAPEWWSNLLRRSTRWINANVKYDAHVLLNDPDIGYRYDKEVVDSTMVAKIIDSDRTYKGGYGLDALSAAWLGVDILPYYNRMVPYLYRPDKNGTLKQFNQDYGRIPLDILAEYACQDPISNRDLHHYELRELPEQCKHLYDSEVRFTSLLLNMERRGIRIDVTKVQIKEMQSKYLMLKLGERVRQLVGHEINPGSPTDMQDLMINVFQLPVLLWTNEEDEDPEAVHNPSFSKDAMVMYQALPEVRNDPRVKETVECLMRLKKEQTMNSLFYEPWQVLHVGGVLHSDHNQTVRSGRMSAKQPNDQQLNTEAKECVVPDRDMCFIDMDLSQIENRLSVHYHGNPEMVRKYVEDPKTDAHEAVGNMCGVKRRTGKTMNLALNFGMGKKKTIANLMSCEDLLEDNPSNFELKRRGTAVFNTFHRNCPELRRTQEKAAAAARRRGFVFNGHGRRLHLPFERSHIAFNRIVQSEAADLFKERCLALDNEMDGNGAYLSALVHDSALAQVPIGMESYWQPRLKQIFETPDVPYKVPIYASSECHYKSWGHCNWPDRMKKKEYNYA